MSTIRPETMAEALRARAEDGLEVPAAGESMGRLIVPGRRVRIEARPRPRAGEVWAYCTDDATLFVHRCRGRHRGGWLLQGDAGRRADPVVAGDRLVGRVVAVEGEDGGWRDLGAGDRGRGLIRVAMWTIRGFLTRFRRHP